MTLLMDYMRGTRLSKAGESTYTLLRPLKTETFNSKVRVGFFHMPDTGTLKGRFSESPFREIFGVHHIKAHVFDDNVLMTGANLSEDYFTDRQDRCMVIQDCAPLAHYLDDLINLLADHSMLITDHGDLQVMTPENTEKPYKAPKAFKNSLAHQLRYFRFTHRTKMVSEIDGEKTQIDEKNDEAAKFFSPDTEDDERLGLEEDPYDAEHHMLQSRRSQPIKAYPHFFNTSMGIADSDQDNMRLLGEKQSQFTKELRQLRSERNFMLETQGTITDDQSSTPDIDAESDNFSTEAGRVYIVPTLQMNVINYKEDE